MVIDNIPGANGAIAGRAVINAPADGYTFLWGVGSMVAIPLLQKSPPFEAFSNFTPVSMVGQFPFGMLTHPSVPAKTVNEFIAYARANSDKLSYASATLSEYMAAAQFMKASGVAMNRVPYKGNAQAMPDLLAGRIQVYFTPISLALPYVNDGRLRMLGALLPQRSPAVPDVPTMTEVGMPGVSIPGWQAIFAPPKTPQGIVDTMSRQINMALQDPEVAAQFDRLTLRVERSTPEILAAIIGRDAESWRVFIHENNIVQD
jgi:tripartite-type tricarboxylate transporter receptor subunit TctC